MTERRYIITGMSCGHCVNSITDEVTQVAGVSDVTVDLATNAVTVRGTDVDDALVRAAITEAGYRVAALEAARAPPVRVAEDRHAVRSAMTAMTPPMVVRPAGAAPGAGNVTASSPLAPGSRLLRPVAIAGGKHTARTANASAHTVLVPCMPPTRGTGGPADHVVRQHGTLPARAADMALSKAARRTLPRKPADRRARIRASRARPRLYESCARRSSPGCA